ncbi:MAG: hypothetical protein ACREME_06750 [Gemmatimonadales bacterium]
MTGGRLLVVAAGLAVWPAARLPAQVSIDVGAGARYSSALVHDSVVVPIDLRPANAPAVFLSVRDDLRGPWSADLTLDVSPSGLRRHEGGTAYDAGSVTTIAFTVGLRRDFRPGVSGRISVGGLTYAGSDAGVFRDGSGGLFPVVGVAATYALRRFAIEARYDLHRFITPALRTMRFSTARPVHRIGLVVSARVFGPEP